MEEWDYAAARVLRSRNQIISPAIGMPTKVFGSCRTRAFSESPSKLIVRTTIASLRPHSALRASPIALKPQAPPTMIINAIDMPRPRCRNSTRASGFNCQIDSRKLPGNARAKIMVKPMRAPAAKKIVSKVLPRDRWCKFTCATAKVSRLTRPSLP